MEDVRVSGLHPAPDGVDREYRSAAVETPLAAGPSGRAEDEAASWQDVALAAAEAGGEVILAVPDGGDGSGVIVRFADEGGRLVFLAAERDGALRVVEEEGIDEGLAQFARTSIDLFEHIRADRRIAARVAQH